MCLPRHLFSRWGRGAKRADHPTFFSGARVGFWALVKLGNTPTPPPAAALPWCTCGNCREMTTDLERKCYGQGPINCISQLPHFNLYCLEDGYLRLHRQYRNDVWLVGDAREPGDDNREFRYAAYWQYIFWQHGSICQCNMHVIPSCCVWKIREKYPDPLGQYTSLVPTIWFHFQLCFVVHMFVTVKMLSVIENLFLFFNKNTMLKIALLCLLPWYHNRNARFRSLSYVVKVHHVQLM